MSERRAEETNSAVGTTRTRVRLVTRVIGIALALNALAWIGASLGSDVQESWKYVSLLGFFLLGLIVGRWWALLVTFTFGFIHAIPVYLGVLPGYLSSWGEALWWLFSLIALSLVTSLGVLMRRASRRFRGRAGA